MALDHEKANKVKSDLKDILENAPTDNKNTATVVDQVFERLPFVKEIEDSRPPRIYVFGRSGAGKSSLINALANKSVAEIGDVEPTTMESEVYEIGFSDRYANWQVVDSRGLFESISPEGGLPADTVSIMKEDLAEYQPDILLHVMTPDQVRAGQEDFDVVEEFRQELGPLFPPVVYCLNKVDTHLSPGGAWPPGNNPSLQDDIQANLDFVSEILGETERRPLDKQNPYFGYKYDSEEYVGTVPVYLKEEPFWNVNSLSWIISDFLPDDARLQFIQAQKRDELMRQWSRKKTNQTAAAAGGVGFVPMPGADFGVLTGMQLMLVAVIGSASCRELSWDTVSDYLSAMGGTVVAGMGARGLARSLVQVVPFGGTAISTAIAYSTTWAIGRSAEEYFYNDNVVKPSGFIDEGREKFKNKFDR